MSIYVACYPKDEHPLILECLRKTCREDVLLAAQMLLTSDYLSTHSILHIRSFPSLMYSVYGLLELDTYTGISLKLTFSTEQFFGTRNFK
jgi:hypothetical protein